MAAPRPHQASLGEQFELLLGQVYAQDSLFAPAAAEGLALAAITDRGNLPPLPGDGG